MMKKKMDTKYQLDVIYAIIEEGISSEKGCQILLRNLVNLSFIRPISKYSHTPCPFRKNTQRKYFYLYYFREWICKMRYGKFFGLKRTITGCLLELKSNGSFIVNLTSSGLYQKNIIATPIKTFFTLMNMLNFLPPLTHKLEIINETEELYSYIEGGCDTCGHGGAEYRFKCVISTELKYTCIYKTYEKPLKFIDDRLMIYLYTDIRNIVMSYIDKEDVLRPFEYKGHVKTVYSVIDCFASPKYVRRMKMLVSGLRGWQLDNGWYGEWLTGKEGIKVFNKNKLIHNDLRKKLNELKCQS